MKFLSSKEIREIWLSFFQKNNHLIVKSASLIPDDDDKTLLWVNSGVATLKKFFDGRKMTPNKRITSIQKSIRTNDIENVGKTSSHNTFFEMMGNFSIGDYFRDEAINYCFELLTNNEYFAIPVEKLYITYYLNDKKTFDKWISLGIKKNHLIASKDNFWEIGCGPCGPNTEIYFDRGEKYDPNKKGVQLIIDNIDNDRFIEIWNLVFSQFNAEIGVNRDNYKELPHKNIDTGAGLERFACIFQGTETNFETDLFLPIIQKISELTLIKYDDQSKIFFRIIADHIKTCVFAISDGAYFSNDGRNYVLRKLLRRAVMCSHKLGIDKPFIFNLVDTVINIYSSFYPELIQNRDKIIDSVKNEENNFFRVLKDGMKIFKKMISDNKIDSFKLYDTFGFPIELTSELAKDYGIKVDLKNFHEKMLIQKQKSKRADNIQSMQIQSKDLINFVLPSKFNYENKCLKAKIIGLFVDGKKVDKIPKNCCGELIFDETNFYFLGGGQICDTGFAYSEDSLKRIFINSVIKAPNGQGLHFFKNVGEVDIKLNDELFLKVNEDLIRRRMIECNHTATHLLNKTLKKILNDQNIVQQGSYVSDEYFHFDFNYANKITDDVLNKIENEINFLIIQNIDLKVRYFLLEEAKKIGAEMHFEDKYDDLVRVVEVAESKEFCCGTHVKNTSQIGIFKIITNNNIANGIQRIVACTSLGAFKKINCILNETKKYLNTDINNLVSKIKCLFDKNKNYSLDFKKKISSFAKNIVFFLNKEVTVINGYKIIMETLFDVEFDLIKNIFTLFKKNNVNYLIILISIDQNNKRNNLHILTDIQTINAHEIIKEIFEIAGGTGGGNLSEAHGFINDINKIIEIKQLIKNKL